MRRAGSKQDDGSMMEGETPAPEKVAREIAGLAEQTRHVIEDFWRRQIEEAGEGGFCAGGFEFGDQIVRPTSARVCWRTPCG
ncbi:MAG: hypothetical protein HC871_08055 [Rhizobiales bacterium]|nr:hypothetical protein [Hyphomicrobiales bacterium]